VEVISTLVTEVKLTVSKDGIDVKAVDPSHVAMLVLKLNKAAFEEFTGEPTEIGLDVEKLKEVLRLSKPGDLIDLQFDGGKNRLVVKVGKVTRHMSVIDPAGITDPKVPNVSPPGIAVVKMEELRQGIRGSESISDHVSLMLDAEGFTMCVDVTAVDYLERPLRAPPAQRVRPADRLRPLPVAPADQRAGPDAVRRSGACCRRATSASCRSPHSATHISPFASRRHKP